MDLDVSFVRSHFPALTRGWALFDNAGGSVVPAPVAARVADYMARLAVQLGASYALSAEASAAVDTGVAAAAALIGCDPEEVVLGGSTTINVYVLANALAAGFAPGDELIVTNIDHEANIGAWRRLEARGLVIREWRLRPETATLHLDDLGDLLTERTRLVCCSHVSNLVGAIHDVAAIAKRVHDAGALLCVDGVAHAPHRRVDVQALGVDFYLVSLYKVFGPHLGLMYVNRDQLAALPGQNHHFIKTGPYKLEPGGANHELTASLPGILDYLGAVDAHHRGTPSPPPGAVAGATAAYGLGPGPGSDETAAMLTRTFERFAAHERRLAKRLLDFLSARPGVRVIGPTSADPETRVATVSFAVDGRHAGTIPPKLDDAKLAVRWGDFYAPRLVKALGLADRGGVVRVSMAHYNSDDEITALLTALDQIL